MEKKLTKMIGVAAGISGAMAAGLTIGRKMHASVPEEVRAFEYAEGGLADPENGMPANCLPAFEEAAANGIGIIADVRLCHDGVPVLFKDEYFMDHCGEEGVVEGSPWEWICHYKLDGTEYTIPGLMAMFNVVDDRVPIILNLHSGNDNVDALCGSVLARMDAYEGLVLITSTEKKILRWFKENAPEYITVGFGKI